MSSFAASPPTPADAQYMQAPLKPQHFGNAAVQLIACGKIENAAKAREIISRSEEIKTYTPCDTEKWEEYYEIFKKVTEN